MDKMVIRIIENDKKEAEEVEEKIQDIENIISILDGNEENRKVMADVHNEFLKEMDIILARGRIIEKELRELARKNKEKQNKRNKYKNYVCSIQ